MRTVSNRTATEGYAAVGSALAVRYEVALTVDDVEVSRQIIRFNGICHLTETAAATGYRCKPGVWLVCSVSQGTVKVDL